MPRKVTALFQCHCPTLYLTNSRLKQNKIYTFACRHWFATSRGTRQEDPIPPTVFIADLEKAMDKVKNGEEGISVHGIKINNLRFADDIDIIEKDKSKKKSKTRSLWQPRSPQWTHLDEILHWGSSRRRNHLFQILCQSVEGFRICARSNFAILS